MFKQILRRILGESESGMLRIDRTSNHSQGTVCRNALSYIDAIDSHGKKKCLDEKSEELDMDDASSRVFKATQYGIGTGTRAFAVFLFEASMYTFIYRGL